MPGNGHDIMKPDYSAIPKLHSPEPDPAGRELDEVSWAARIDRLRPRLLALAPRELCDFCREAHYHDLFGLVVSTPLSEAALERLRAALTPAVFDMLAKDCAEHGPSLLGADLACGAFKRLDTLLTRFMAARATPEQVARLEALALQMARLDETLLETVLTNLRGAYLDALMKSSGGGTGELARRLRAHFDDKTWELLQRYADAEPISAEEAEEAIVELPVALTGQDWKSPQQRWDESAEGQRQQREFEASIARLLHNQGSEDTPPPT